MTPSVIKRRNASNCAELKCYVQEKNVPDLRLPANPYANGYLTSPNAYSDARRGNKTPNQVYFWL
jgi:hypothetical protein